VIAALSSGAVIGPVAAAISVTVLLVTARRTDTREGRDRRYARTHRLPR
jgi:hypothetical protein